MFQGNEHILVVDDDSAICETFAKGLSRVGYHCETAGSADEAVRILQQQQFHVMLLDIAMPGKGGLALLPEVIARYPDMVILMVTGHDDTSTAILAMQQGAYDYVTKPVPLSLLIMRVEKALARRALLVDNKAYQVENQAHQEDNQAYQAEDKAQVELEGSVQELKLQLEQSRRELAALQTFVKSNMAEQESPAEAYVRRESSVTDIGSIVESQANLATGVITVGEVQLDEKIGGGIPRGALTLIEGEPASGKSVLCQHLIYGALMSNLAVAFYSSEETPQSLLSQMRSIGLDLDKCPRGYKLSMYTLEDPLPDEGGDTSLAALATAMDNLPDNPELIVVDAITNQALYSEEKSILSFFSSCKRMCRKGKTVILVTHSSIIDEQMFVRVRPICDGNLSLRVEKEGENFSQFLEVRKMHRADRATGNIVKFEVEPGMGIVVKVSYGRAKA